MMDLRVREEHTLTDPETEEAARRHWGCCARLRVWNEDSSWQERLEMAEHAIKHAMEQERKEAVQQWKARLQRHADRHSAKSYAFIKGDVHPGLCAMRYQHDRVCLSLDAQDHAMRQFWTQISDRPPDAEHQSVAFGEYANHNCDQGDIEWRFPPLTLQAFQAALARLKPKGAAGIDGWRPRELKALPPAAIEELMIVMAHCERAQSFPDLLQQGITTLIPKTKGALRASQYRPSQ